MSSMNYSFRIRLNRAASCTLDIEEQRLDLLVENECQRVSLNAPSNEKSIKDAERWLLIGEGFSSEGEALQAGADFQDAILLCLTKARLGVDAGHRAPKGYVTDYGLQFLSDTSGQRVLNDVHGLMTYSSEPKPVFSLVSINAVRCMNAKSFKEIFHKTISLKPNLAERDRLAISLFHESFFQRAAHARFLLLVMAIETLLDLEQKSEIASKLVGQFIQQVGSSRLVEGEKASIIGSLQWLRKESINQAGKRLSKFRLGSSAYGGRTAEQFFSYAYRLRSTLLHGRATAQTFAEIAKAVGPLELFVSDFVTAPWLGPPDNADPAPAI
jgi:hypothetical protein